MFLPQGPPWEPIPPWGDHPECRGIHLYITEKCLRCYCHFTILFTIKKNNFLHHTLLGPCHWASLGHHDTLDLETNSGMGGAGLRLPGTWERVRWPWECAAWVGPSRKRVKVRVTGRPSLILLSGGKVGSQVVSETTACLPGPVASEHHSQCNPTPHAACSVRSHQKPPDSWHSPFPKAWGAFA